MKHVNARVCSTALLSVLALGGQAQGAGGTLGAGYQYTAVWNDSRAAAFDSAYHGFQVSGEGYVTQFGFLRPYLAGDYAYGAGTDSFQQGTVRIGLWHAFPKATVAVYGLYGLLETGAKHADYTETWKTQFAGGGGKVTFQLVPSLFLSADAAVSTQFSPDLLIDHDAFGKINMQTSGTWKFDTNLRLTYRPASWRGLGLWFGAGYTRFGFDATRQDTDLARPSADFSGWFGRVGLSWTF